METSLIKKNTKRKSGTLLDFISKVNTSTPTSSFNATPSSTSTSLSITSTSVIPVTSTSTFSTSTSSTSTSAPTSTSIIPITSTLDSRYWISKKTIPLSNLCDYRVMAIPTNRGFLGEDPEPFPLYLETPTQIGVPRFFGMERHGFPTTCRLTDGEPMNSDVTFTWKLQDTPQRPQIAASEAWLNQGHKGIICLGCGAGKTAIAIYLACKMGRKTLILVHNEGLAYQWIERIQSICPKASIGMIQQKKRNIDGFDFVIGMIQTVRGVDENFDTFGMLIVDECHHIAAKTFSQSVFKTRTRYILGLSATPDRKDGLSYVIHWLLGPIVFRAERQDIVPQTIYQIEYPLGNQKVIKYRNGVLGLPTMITRMSEDTKRNDLIHLCLTRLVNTPGITKIIVISDRREHLIYLHDKYQNQYSCGLYIGQLKKTDLESAKTKHVIFASYGMANEFLDISGLNGMILATPATGNLEQIIGRLRENVAKYDGVPVGDTTCYEDALNERILPWLSYKVSLLDRVKDYLRPSRHRIVLDIVDPFDIFQGMAWKRYRAYKNLQYYVKRMPILEFCSLSCLVIKGLESGTNLGLVDYIPHKKHKNKQEEEEYEIQY